MISHISKRLVLFRCVMLSFFLTSHAEVDKSSFAYLLAAGAVSTTPAPDNLVLRIESELELIEMILPGASNWPHHDPRYMSNGYYVYQSGLYIFTNGWGDCPSGCTNREYWYFQVTDDAVLGLTPEEAAPLTGIRITSSPSDTIVDTEEEIEFQIEVEYGRPFPYCYTRWERSGTADFQEPEQLYGQEYRIPFVRLSDEGYYRFAVEPYQTGLQVFSDPFFLKVTDLNPPSDPGNIVEIPDQILRQKLLDDLQLESAPIGRLEMEQLYHISISQHAQWGDPIVGSLEGLQYAVNLRTLSIADNMVYDLSPIAGLSKLEWLDLGFKNSSVAWWLWPITDISPLRDLVNLEFLDLSANQISDLEPLRNLRKLHFLHLWGNRISNIDALENLALESVDLTDNFIDFSLGQPAREIAEKLIARGVSFSPDISRNIHTYATEFRFEAGGGMDLVPHGILDPSLNGIFPMAEWIWLEESVYGDRETVFHVEPNLNPDPRDSKIMVFNRAFHVHQDGSPGPWQEVNQISGRWWESSWFGMFYPADSSWIWHDEHGWQCVTGNSEESLFLYDMGLNSWLWTSKSIYPFLFRFGESPGWLYYLRDGSPGSRWFLETGGTWIHEGD